MRIFYVENCKNNELLTKYICSLFPNLSKNILYKSIRNKDIRINEVKINKDCKISEGDKITIYITDTYLFGLPTKLEYIYVDDNILAVYKPQGLLSNIEYYDNESENSFEYIGGIEPSLEELVKKDYPNATIGHRLDRNTSGIVLFSLNDISKQELLLGFKKGFIEKQYIAYVAGSNFEKDYNKLTRYLLKDSKSGYVKVFNELVDGSQKIETDYNVITKDSILDYAILDVTIHTGKTHQIRVQMKDIGHPIIGDSKYGQNLINKKFKIYKQMLYAYRYTFRFSKISTLYYLNNIVIELDKKYYTKNLGESYEKKDG